MTAAVSPFIAVTIGLGLLAVVGVTAVLLTFWGGLYAAVRVAKNAWGADG